MQYSHGLVVLCSISSDERSLFYAISDQRGPCWASVSCFIGLTLLQIGDHMLNDTTLLLAGS